MLMKKVISAKILCCAVIIGIMLQMIIAWVAAVAVDSFSARPSQISSFSQNKDLPIIKLVYHSSLASDAAILTILWSGVPYFLDKNDPHSLAEDRIPDFCDYVQANTMSFSKRYHIDNGDKPSDAPAWIQQYTPSNAPFADILPKPLVKQQIYLEAYGFPYAWLFRVSYEIPTQNGSVITRANGAHGGLGPLPIAIASRWHAALGLTFWTIATYIAIAIPGVYRRIRYNSRIERLLCPHCGYPIKTESSRCSECGAGLSPVN